MDTASLVRHGIECHSCLGLHVEAPAVIVELNNLGVGIHLRIHGTYFHGKVGFPMFAFYDAVFQQCAEWHLEYGVLLVGIETRRIAQLQHLLAYIAVVGVI